MRTLLLTLICCIALTVTAQKLPSVQKLSLHAPANIKIDGKATEWGTLSAYNNATNIYYTIANDDQKLYLTVQASDSKIITKIVNGGISFAVSKIAKKIDANTIAICYPMYDSKNRPSLDLAGETEGAATKADLMKVADSIATVNNYRMIQKMKWIRVNGIKGLDTLSIYNDDGIWVASQIDNKRVYTYELAVDLKQVGLDPAKPEKFYYNIKLNGIQATQMPGMTLITDPDGTVTGMNVTNARLAMGYSESLNPTDLWGEYKLLGKE